MVHNRATTHLIIIKEHNLILIPAVELDDSANYVSVHSDSVTARVWTCSQPQVSMDGSHTHTRQEIRCKLTKNRWILVVLTQPSCTFRVASSFSLWTNSLLPVEEEEVSCLPVTLLFTAELKYARVNIYWIINAQEAASAGRRRWNREETNVGQLLHNNYTTVQLNFTFKCDNLLV